MLFKCLGFGLRCRSLREINRTLLVFLLDFFSSPIVLEFFFDAELSGVIHVLFMTY